MAHQSGRPQTSNGINECTFRLVLVGESAVGKSSLALRFAMGHFNDNQESTIGAAFFIKKVLLQEENTTVKFEIWDTAGQERFHSLAPMYYRNAPAAIVTYDITNQESFTKAKEWVRELQHQGRHDVIIALAANKIDMEENRNVSRQEGADFAERNNMIFFETSARSGKNVSEIFMALAKRLPRDGSGNYISPSQNNDRVDVRNENRQSDSSNSRICCK